MIWHHFDRFRRDESGATLVITAISAPVLIGLAALGTEAGYLYMKHAALQSAAEVSVISAANAITNGAEGTAEANSIAAAMGYVNNVAGITVKVNSPAESGAYKGVAGTIEVVIDKQQEPILSALFRKSPYDIAGRSVAMAGSNRPGKGCIIALNPGAGITGLTMTGTSDVNMSGCDAYVNSSSSDAADANGNMKFTVDNLNVVGSIGGNGTINGETHTGQAPINDPYAGVPFPSKAGCDYTNINVKKTNVIKAVGPVTTICGGLNLTNGDSVEFEPGVYLFQDKTLAVQGGTLSGNGVTLAFADDAYAKITGATVNLTAPSTGTYEGMAVMSSDNNTNTFKLTGGTQTITGVIHLPSAPLEYNGNSSSSGSGGCTQLVASQITFTGTVQVGSECKDVAGVKTIGGFTPSALLE